MNHVCKKCNFSKEYKCSFVTNYDIKCNQKCTKILKCGHQCNKLCGEDCYPCTQKCTKVLPCGHKATKLCFENYDPICRKKCTKVLPCGHKCTNLCYQKCNTCTKKCERILACGHKCNKLCYEDCNLFTNTLYNRSMNPNFFGQINSYMRQFMLTNCKEKIKVKRSCGHSIILPCGIDAAKYKRYKPCTEYVEHKCRCNKSFRIACTKRFSFQCVEIVDKKLKCGHSKRIYCKDSENPKILKNCTREIWKKLKCGHSKRMVCKDSDNQNIINSCDQFCNKRLSCGHKCLLRCQEHFKHNFKNKCICECYYYQFTITKDTKQSRKINTCLPDKKYYLKIQINQNSISLVSKCKKGTCYICHRKQIHSDCQRVQHSFKAWDQQLKNTFSCDMEFNTAFDVPIPSEFSMLQKIYKIDYNSNDWPVLINNGFFSGYVVRNGNYSPRENQLSDFFTSDLRYTVEIKPTPNLFRVDFHYSIDYLALNEMVVSAFLIPRE